MSSNTFDRAESQYKRKVARQKHLEKFEEVSSALTPDGSEHRNTTRQYDWEHGDVAFESARRFLRDEDEENGLQDESLSDHSKLWGNRQGSGGGGEGKKSSPLAGGDWDNSSVIRGNEDPDMDLRSAYGNIYDGQAYQEESTSASAFLSPIGGFFLGCFHACFKPCSILSEYVIAAVLKFCSYTRKQKLIMLGGLTAFGLAIWGIVALTTRGGGDDGGGSSTTGSQDNGGGGSGHFQPGHPLVPQDPKRYEEIREYIVDSGITHADHLDKQGSYQNRALWWIVEHDAAHVHTNTSGLLQRYALANLFFSTYVESFVEEHNNHNLSHATALIGEQAIQWTDSTNWMTKKDICEWFGVHCVDNIYGFNDEEASDANTNVVRLELKENNIVGEIPSELVALDQLATLDLGGNKLYGSIPKEIGGFKHLVNLHLNDNELTGAIPPEVAQCRYLRIMDLTNNELVGSIPTMFARMHEIRTFKLAENMLAGPLPILNMSKIVTLYFNDNQLSGTIPTEYGKMLTLVEMDLRNNELRGNIPSQFGYLSNLEAIGLGFNMLSGSIPVEIGGMAKLTDLEIQHNKINGTIPDEIGALSRLEVLHIEHNELSGTIPDAVGTLEDLRVFHFFSNHLTGEVPEPLCNPDSAPRPKTMAGDCSEVGGTITCSCCEQCHS